MFCGFIIFENLLLNLPNDIMSNSLQVEHACGSNRHGFISPKSIIHLFVQKYLHHHPDLILHRMFWTQDLLLVQWPHVEYYVTVIIFFLPILQLCLCVSSYLKALNLKSSSLKKGTNQTVELSACLTVKRRLCPGLAKKCLLKWQVASFFHRSFEVQPLTCVERKSAHLTKNVA